MSLARCFSTLGCPDFSLDQALALAVKHDVPALELRALGGTLDLPTYFAAQFSSPHMLAERVRQSGVCIAAFDASLHLVGATPAERAQLLALVPWADALGVRWVRVFDGGKSANASEITEAVETIRWWRDLRRHNGWQADIMVETHDSLFTAAIIQRLLDRVPDIAVLWDTHHTWKRGGEDPIVTWSAIKSRVVHVHVKDSVSVPSPQHPFTYVAPGTGEFPMARLRPMLESEYSGATSLEWERLWHPYLGPVAEALQAAAHRGWW